MTYTRPAATTGLLYPGPISARHSGAGSFDTKVSITPVSFHCPSRPAPRHCGQSSADASAKQRDTVVVTRIIRGVMMDSGKKRCAIVRFATAPALGG